jgi:hypothetical protein
MLAADQSANAGPTSHLLRNYERRLQRAARTESENSELREASRANREVISDVETLLEEVLAMDDLQAGVYEKLARASEMLMAVQSRLR